jgi:hypothetical protein
MSNGSHYFVEGFFITEQLSIVYQRDFGDSYIRKWSVLVNDRAFRRGRGVSVRDRGSLCMGSSGGHTGLFVGFEFG